MKNKTFRSYIIGIIEIIFGIGIAVCLFVGGISFLGYVAAIIIGGDTAAVICNIIYKSIYPILTRIATTTILLGLVKMYISGETALKIK